MKPSNPIIIDGKTYDLYSLNLAVNGRYNDDGTSDASIAVRFIPTRIDNGQVDEAQEQSVNIALGSISNADEPTLTAVAEISAAIQKFIYAKGI